MRPRPSIIDRNLGRLIQLVAVAIAVLVVKPWAWLPGGSDGAQPTPGPTAVATLPTPEPTAHLGFEDLAYDPSIFGTREPTAQWDLWPGAYLVTYGFVIQLGGPNPTAIPVPIGSPAHLPGPTAGASPTLPADRGPAWPDSVTIPAGYHLFLIGIDMPLGYDFVAAHLYRLAPGSGQATEVGLFRPPSPWPDHFAVIGIPAAAGPDHLSVWAPGSYRLDLAFEPGHISRSIEVDIEAPPGSPATSPLPS